MNKLFVLVISILSSSACSKSSSSGGNTSPTPQEPNIQFTIDASDNSISLGNTYQVNVTLTSALPTSQGIKIEASLVDQNTNKSITQNTPITSNTIKNAINIISLPQQHWCLATVKVSSVATPGNNSTKNFTLVYK